MTTQEPACTPQKSRFSPGVLDIPLQIICVALLLCSCTSGQALPKPEVQGNTPTNPTDSSLPPCIRAASPETAKVIDVIDGDTITVSLEGQIQTIRYLGVDTPEMTASDPYFGRLAKQRNQSLVTGKTVTIYPGDADKDDFGRLLRFVFVDDAFINRDLVQEGLATSFNRPHDSVCAKLFTEAMVDAYHARIGIWEDIDTVYRDGPPLCPNGYADHPKGCNIKGNITAQDDYIYHVPSSPDYPDVKIQPEKGERWFCTLEEALNMGWRPPRQE